MGAAEKEQRGDDRQPDVDGKFAAVHGGDTLAAKQCGKVHTGYTLLVVKQLLDIYIGGFGFAEFK